MKKLLLTASALALMTSAAAAADLPSRKHAPVAPVAAPAFTWTGFYVGANAGYAWGEKASLPSVTYPYYTYYNIPVGHGYGAANLTEKGSFSGGVQAGYNYQMGQFVVGAEADINYVDVKRTASVNILGGFYSGLDQPLQARSSVEWFGTVRARLGFVPTERLLVFATGGLAYGGVKNSLSYDLYVPFDAMWLGGVHGSRTETRVGWTLGAGVEYAITDNVTLKGEYAYVDLGKKTHAAYASSGIIASIYGGAYVTARDNAKFHVVRVGLNYKF